MSEFDWIKEIPDPHDLAEEYGRLKREAASDLRYEDAAKYRDLEREILELPKFDSTEAWLKVFKEMTESGEMLRHLKMLSDAYGQR